MTEKLRTILLPAVFLGFWAVLLMLFFLLFLYFLIYRRPAILENKRKLSFVLSLLTAVTIASYTLMHRVV